MSIAWLRAIDWSDWHVYALVLSGVFSLWSLVPYVQDILRRNTRPNAVSFFLWTVCEIIAFFAQIKEGASLSIVIMGLVVFNTTIIFVLAIAGYGYKQYHWTDILSFCFSILAMGLWLSSGPIEGIKFAIAADFFAAIPTIKKAWKDPLSEHFGGWILIGVACWFGALSTKKLDFANLAFPWYLALANLLILACLYFGRRRLAKAT